MFNRFNKFQAAVALALLSRGALGDSYTNSTSSADLSSITSVSSASASATASDSLSSSDGTVYLPSTTISGDLRVTGKVIATEPVEVAAGGKLTLLDGEKYVFSSDLKVHGDLVVEKSEASYEGTAFDVSGETFEVSGNFSAEETGAVSASIYSFTPSSFKSSGDISLSLSKAKKGEVTFSPYSNAGTFSLSNAILNGGSVSGLQRRDDTEGSVNNGEINLDNGSTYVIVEPVSGKGTVNIISGNLYLHYPDTFTGQTVVFKGEGVLAVDPTETNATPIPVVGYTGENQIAITADVTALSYDSATGVLTATQGNSQFSFSIGTGFSSSGFNVSEGIFAGAYSYYLNYDGVIATSAAPTSASTTFGVVSTATGSVTLSSNASTTVSSTISSSASISGVSNSTIASGSIASTASAASAASATSFTSGSASVYTTTLTYLNATSTVVVSCSETTDASGNIYTITTTVPCSSTTATITSCDQNGCHVPAPTATDATATVSFKSYTTVTVTHCDNNGCSTKTVTSEAPKETSATTTSPKSYTTVTVTHCDDNGCNTKTVTSEASKQTSLATSTVTKSAAPTSHTAASSTFTGIVVQSEGMAAGLRTNVLSTLAGIFILGFF
ncbi:CPS_HP_G0104910.mRNA.1.CDS.1 [Saccharomyces cerevisiae]|nr:CPS_HP_G0101480.mRNA.1.CDS.1 [Saccharomyces cerevisiae]CAI5035243.1 CPS_HP_G0104910.mRNA.1.CDS.1 [Saccharomyces cerevisiae]CAI6947569.1 CPS_HP_G0101480.mRNA.1.CDS.1 [Saccharomyces cerevisiae]CAI6952438.1 CPS_HP_G0104910.mRNA.1.CDS.1 [Saccharomyces cerevisiae]